MPCERNAIILAAGTSSRFVPLSAEMPKGLLEVKGEVLIERQIRQLIDAGVSDITVVTGYKAEMFEYLRHKYGVELVYNDDYYRYNNVSSIIRVLDRLGDTFICSSDNYFPKNVFLPLSDQSYYSAQFAAGGTNEYCITVDQDDNIQDVSVGGHDSWFMIGHVYFSRDFSCEFMKVLEKDFLMPATKQEYWEDVYIRHLKELPRMKINRCDKHEIEEFDSIDELRKFDSSYINDTRSTVLKRIADELGCQESALAGFKNLSNDGKCLRFSFNANGKPYEYNGSSDLIIQR